MEAGRLALEQRDVQAKVSLCQPGNRPCIRVNEGTGGQLALLFRVKHGPACNRGWRGLWQGHQCRAEPARAARAGPAAGTTATRTPAPA